MDLQCARENLLKKLDPSRMRVIPYAWPLRPDVCPCDVHFCEYLKEKRIRGKSIFHFGTGEHHLVGRRNGTDGLDNQVLGITASPLEHDAYVKLIVGSPDVGGRYRVLFGDIYNLVASALPVFDVVTLFHLFEYAEPPSQRRTLDDPGLLRLFLSKMTPGGRIVFYRQSSARTPTARLLAGAIEAGEIALEEVWQSLEVFRVPTSAASEWTALASG
jgi:hypothetical protein